MSFETAARKEFYRMWKIYENDTIENLEKQWEYARRAGDDDAAHVISRVIEHKKKEKHSKAGGGGDSAAGGGGWPSTVFIF